MFSASLAVPTRPAWRDGVCALWPKREQTLLCSAGYPCCPLQVQMLIPLGTIPSRAQSRTPGVQWKQLRLDVPPSCLTQPRTPANFSTGFYQYTQLHCSGWTRAHQAHPPVVYLIYFINFLLFLSLPFRNSVITPSPLQCSGHFVNPAFSCKYDCLV